MDSPDKFPAPDASTRTMLDVRLEQAAARDWSHTAGSVWLDAAEIWTHMSQNTNQPRAAMKVDWGALCPPAPRCSTSAAARGG